ncbi:type IV pilus assembly PilZ [Pseudodesulfovibrio mercurii]|uniref:Type IV pilus assembly PilZ n=1 Tax=Pseudodesulfovibrio mercurii TaxID=641491 RepID=F0JGM8_9BACT|nr:PilZ domain-containing protein [Pseudodesulfovibrio mercurii]EGB13897.1 type IV pilus assembly PilZ [Pseudodesulfovibrio mercurii]
MDIAVGDSIILEVSTFEDRFLGLVAGLGEDGRLTVFADVPDAVVKRLATDTFALVRYAYDGRLLGFTTRVLQTLDTPGTLFELAAPQRVFDAEERCEPRCCCTFPAFVANGKGAVRGVLEDMSDSCARVRFVDDGPDGCPAEKGGRVRLTFHPFDMAGEGIGVGCTVVKTFMRNHAHYAVLRFNNDEPDARKRISGFIEAQVCCRIPGT